MPALLALLLSVPLAASDTYPPPRFSDPDRVAKLQSAMPEIDRLFRAYATDKKIPGMALLTYNLVNFITGPDGRESVGTRWNSTTVFQRRGDQWRSIHSHWSFTQHPAFQTMSPEASEGLEPAS